ncbi:MAG: lactonase family protein, partial [Cyclobacteriaceae bacterium]
MKFYPAVILFTVFVASCKSGNEQSDNTIQNEMATEALNTPVGFYIGTYTKDMSQGIYYSTFDPMDGSFGDPGLSAAATDPSFLVLSQNGENLYAVSESLDENGESALLAFSASAGGKLNPIDTISSGGAYACYITTDGAGRFVLAANYGTGNVISAGISVDGGFTDEVYISQHEGSGPNTERQQSPHAHSIRLDPNDVINELDATIAAYTYNQESGILDLKQTVPTLPEGYTGDNKCADIHVHPNGRFLYGSNRGHDSIVVYGINEDGTLEMKGHYSDNVEWPRNFAISPDGGYLVIANEQGNSIISARIDQNS